MKAKTGFEVFVSRVTKEEFQSFYFSHSKPETMEHFNIGSHVFSRFLKQHNIVKPKEAVTRVRKTTCTQVYGVDNVFKDKKRVEAGRLRKYGSRKAYLEHNGERVRQGIQKRYGSGKAFHNAGDEQRKYTCVQRYGCEYASSSLEIKEKIKASKLERYGDANYNNIEQTRKTNLERYGVEYNFASNDPSINGRGTYHRELKDDPEFRANVVAKKKRTCEGRFGTDYYINQIKQMIDAVSSKAQSRVNTSFGSYLISCGIPFTKEVVVGSFVYDFCLGKTLIEVDPYATHNSTWGIFGNPKAKDYHRRKTLNALQAGYKCVHVYDWTDAPLLMYHVINKTFSLKDTGEERAHYYNYKEKKLVENEGSDTVLIYDDGFEVIYNGNEN